MKIVLENEDLTIKIFEVSEANCYIKDLKNSSGLIENESKFESAISIFKALYSGARAILYDTSNKSLHVKLKESLKLPTLTINSQENMFSNINYDFMLFTSGTTGEPTGVFKTKSDIFTEVDILKNIVAKYNLKKMVATVPFVHIYGILMLELARKLNIDIWLRERFLPNDLAMLVEQGSAIATTPLYINALLQSNNKYDFSNSLFISSTSPLSCDIAQKFCDKFNTNLLQLYGSTETGGIAYRFNNEKLWQPMQEVKCSLNSENCLHVSSPWVSEYKYENKLIHLNKEIDTFDEVKFYGEKFNVLGRKGYIVKIGGKRYSCLQIESIIETHHFVKSALVDMYNNKEQNSLKDEGLIVYIEGIKPPLLELKKLIKNELGTVNFPMKIVIVDNIPTSSLGKKLRNFNSLKFCKNT